MADLDQRFEDLKKKVKKSESDAERAQGSLDELKQQLMDNHGCETIEQAEAKLEEYKRRLVAAEGDFEVALENFEEDYANELEKMAGED